MTHSEMILPSKYVQISESYIGLGGVILHTLNGPMTIDELWHKFKSPDIKSSYFIETTFDNVIFALNLLFAIGAIKIDEKGKIYHAFNQS